MECKYMKKLLSLSLMTMLLVSCGQEAPSSAKKISTDRPSSGLVKDYADLYAGITGSGITGLNPSKVKMFEREGSVASQAVIVQNVSEGILSIDMTKLGLVSGAFDVLPINCTLPASLKPRQSCFFEVKLTAPDVEDASDSLTIVESFEVNGHSIPVEAKIANIKSASEVFESEQLYVSRQALNTKIAKTRSYSELILVKNSYKTPIEVAPSLVDIDAKGGEFAFSHNCPASLSNKTNCIMSIEFTSDNASVGEIATAKIQLSSGVQIPVSIEIEADPSTINALRVQEISLLNTQNYYNVYNDSKNYQFTPEFNLGENLLLEYPSAVLISNACSSSLAPTEFCQIRMAWDPALFHNGIEFSKDFEIQGETFSINFIGSSPCDPGQKLNRTTRVCEPNPGVFDSADSLFGYAVFQ